VAQEVWLATLVELLDPEAVYVADGGGKVTAARRPVHGADGAAVKKRINQHIHPPVDDAGEILAAADRVYLELPFFPRDEKAAA
jgi:NADH dehydrogenase